MPLYLSPLPARPAAAMAVMFATRLLAHRASALTVVLAAHTLADWAHTVFVVLPASLSAHRTDAVVAVISTELICIRHGIILMSPDEGGVISGSQIPDRFSRLDKQKPTTEAAGCSKIQRLTPPSSTSPTALVALLQSFYERLLTSFASLT